MVGDQPIVDYNINFDNISILSEDFSHCIRTSNILIFNLVNLCSDIWRLTNKCLLVHVFLLVINSFEGQQVILEPRGYS